MQSDATVTRTRRLFVYNAGFLNRRIRRILALAGWQVTTGHAGPEDWIGVWGRSPTAWRGERMAERSGAGILRIEDAFLRSIHPGRNGDAPAGLLIDGKGVHFDPGAPSELETLLSSAALDDTSLLDRARAAIVRMTQIELSKYNAFDTALAPPEPGYVLIVDQASGDASLRCSGAGRATFQEMLTVAQIEHPGCRILIRSHPETTAGVRSGHFDNSDAVGQVRFLTAPCSPWRLLDGAVAVYTVSSQLGFEAILAGHRPRVFGQPFYAGWGLSEDERPVDRRTRRLTRPQLFAAAMILHPTWYDPYRDRLCELEEVIDGFEARLRAFREDRRGYVATGMRLWKRTHIRRFFGRDSRLDFRDPISRAQADADRRGVPLLGWASRLETAKQVGADSTAMPLLRVEDGFLRSRGLGAELAPPMSLVRDDLGIYYDPRRESRLERLIAASIALPPDALRRAERLQARLTGAGLSKYNTGDWTLPDLPEGRRILVPGQVEDDASIRLGCGDIRTNLGLLEAARTANPEAILIYKPHPDVEAGLRDGHLPAGAAERFADLVVAEANPIALIQSVDEIWTLTSLLGFEALLRGRDVTCLGTPFYAGWGLTRDLGPVPGRRGAGPTLPGLIHAALIGYPRYLDPVTGLPCPVEVIVDRLDAGISPASNRWLSKLQGLLASRTTFWR